jgi:hypothetical protein
MQVEKIGTGLFRALDEATQGKLTDVWLHCQAKGWGLDISVVTYLDGLADKDMKLYVTATGDDTTHLFCQAPLEGKARVLGWNLYLADKLASARGHVRKAERKIAQATAS